MDDEQESEDHLREQLRAAANVRRQIDVQSRTIAMVGDGGSARNRNALIAELQSELADLEDALTGLGGSHAQGP